MNKRNTRKVENTVKRMIAVAISLPIGEGGPMLEACVLLRNSYPELPMWKDIENK